MTKILGLVKRANKSHIAWGLSRYLAQTPCGLMAEMDNVVPIINSSDITCQECKAIYDKGHD